MNKTQSNFDRGILLLLTLLSAIPFCMPMPNIQGALFAEAMAAFISLLLIATISIAVKQGWHISRMTGWLLAFSGVIGMQMWVIPASFVSVRLWTLLALILAAILISALASWKQSHQITDDEVFNSMCFGLLLGGVANALYALIQIGISILDDNNLQIFGFLGQRNNYGDYVTLSIVALCWLYNQKKIIAALFYPLLCLLSIAVTLSASRTVLIYLVVILLIGVSTLLGKNLKSNNFRFGKILLIAVTIQVSAQVVTPYMMSNIALSLGSKQSAQFYGSLSSLNRVTDDGYDSTIFNRYRMVESMKALQIFSQNPLLGTGWDSYRKESSAMQSDPRFVANVMSNGFYSHSHNLVTNVLAETGVIGGFIIFGGCAWLIFCLLKRATTSCLIASVSLLSIMLSHSMFEFPLWYFQFFTLFCLILWNGQVVPQIESKTYINTIWRLTCSIFCIAGFALLLQGTQWYQLIETNQRPSWTHKISRDHVDQLRPYQGNPLLDFIVTQALISHDGKHVPVANILALLHQYNQYQFLSMYMYKEAILQSQIGNMQRAKKLVKLTISAYPNTLSAIEYQIHQLPLRQQQILCGELNATIQEITSVLRAKNANNNDIYTIFGEKYRNTETRCPILQTNSLSS